MVSIPLVIVSVGNLTTYSHQVNKQNVFFQNFLKILLWDVYQNELIEANRSAYEKTMLFPGRLFFPDSKPFLTTACKYIPNPREKFIRNLYL